MQKIITVLSMMHFHHFRESLSMKRFLVLILILLFPLMLCSCMPEIPKESATSQSTSYSLCVVNNESNIKHKEECDELKSFFEVLPNNNDLIPNEIRAVFYENAPFYYVFYVWQADNDEAETVREIVETNIQDFKYEAYAIKKEDGSIDLPNFCINWKKYAVVDLDDDGINELVYYVYQGGEGFYIIFHVINGIVYGYSEMYRNIYYLYKDGTIEGASGASYFWFERIESFEPTAMNIHVVASHNDDFCSIKNQNVTENDFYDFISKWRSDDGNTQVNWITAQNGGDTLDEIFPDSDSDEN